MNITKTILRIFSYAVISILVVCADAPAYAQGENNVWAFGYNEGLDFNSGQPVRIATNMNAWEGCSSVSSATGSLLFYSNGNDVWDASGNIMPNGSGLFGNGAIHPGTPASSTQGVAIVKVSNSFNRYYVFVLDAYEDVSGSGTPGYLRYSVVDMSLNSGMGDVVAGQKNIIVDSFMGEQMYPVQGDGCFVWIVTLSRVSKEYKVFKVNGSGIHAAIISPGLGQLGFTMGGEMKVSPDRSLIAHIADTVIEIASFNSATGIISQPVLINAHSDSKYGLSFSPDSKKLYCTDFVHDGITQYDVSAFPDPLAIQSSAFVVVPGPTFGNLRLGPDGKIYIAEIDNMPGTVLGSLSRINNPDLAGAACNFEVLNGFSAWNQFPLLPGFYTSRTLGANALILPPNSDTDFSTTNINLCPGSSVTLSGNPLYDNFAWSDGSVASSLTTTSPGIYIVHGQNGCGNYTDSFYVKAIDPSVHILESDTSICQGESLTLHATSGIPGDFVWNTGIATSAITVNQSGTYIYSGTNECGEQTDSIKLGLRECSCVMFVPNAFSPNGDGLNDVFIPVTECTAERFMLNIYNRYGELVFQSYQPAEGWDGYYKSKPANVGTYFYYMRYQNVKTDMTEKKGDLTLVR
jgi:gliding motility-associated-like protein